MSSNYENYFKEFTWMAWRNYDCRLLRLPCPWEIIKHSITEAMKEMSAFVHITAQYRATVKWRKQTPVFIKTKIINQRKQNEWHGKINIWIRRLLRVCVSPGQTKLVYMKCFKYTIMHLCFTMSPNDKQWDWSILF